MSAVHHDTAPATSRSHALPRVESIRVPLMAPPNADYISWLFDREAGWLYMSMRRIARLPCVPDDYDWNCGPCAARRALVETGNLDGIWELFRFLRELVRDLGPCESCESRPAVAVVGGGAAAEFRVCDRCAAEDSREADRG